MAQLTRKGAREPIVRHCRIDTEGMLKRPGEKYALVKLLLNDMEIGTSKYVLEMTREEATRLVSRIVYLLEEI